MKSNSEIAIEVKNVTKKYQLGDTVGNFYLRDEIAGFFSKIKTKNKSKKDYFNALNNVSFKIKRGETVGIIGPNGAGKSTILKILSKITYPTSGEIILNGRVASLLEVGTGFNPDLTGRENIFLNGAILGMTRSEISSKFIEIVKFAEIEKFLDTPVKRYSSGMYVRLAFSIAAHLEPEILLIDEVLAVGDAKFQNKSIGKMNQVTKQNGRTIVLVSHDLGAIKKLCRRSILIDQGKIIKVGLTKDVIDEYVDRIERDTDKEDLKSLTRSGSGNIIVESVYITGKNGKKINYAVSGQPVKFVFDYFSNGNYNKVNLGFSIHTMLSQNIILNQNKYTKDLFDVKKGYGKMTFELDSLPLISGFYLINCRVDINGDEADFPRQPVYKLHVVDGDFYSSGVVPMQHSPVLIKGKWENDQN